MTLLPSAPHASSHLCWAVPGGGATVPPPTHPSLTYSPDVPQRGGGSSLNASMHWRFFPLPAAHRTVLGLVKISPCNIYVVSKTYEVAFLPPPCLFSLPAAHIS